LKEIGELNEELARIVEEIVGSYQAAPEPGRKQGHIPEVTVIADVQGRPGIDQIGEEEVGVEVLTGVQTRQTWVRQNGGVLQDDPNSEFAIELPVPLRPKDVVVEDEQIQTFYDENQALYNIPTTYRTSLLVLQSESEATETVNELESGSSFDVLARERSVDVSSASLGGDIGFISKGQENVDTAIMEAVSDLKAEQWSIPFELSDGRYGIVYAKDIAEGQAFSYKDVKDHIRRELALEQLPQSVSPEAFWKEFDTEWFYSE